VSNGVGQDTGQQEQDQRGKERLAAFMATAILLVVVLAIVLWLWKPWRGGGGSTGGSSGGGYVIGEVAGKERDADYVAVWVKPGNDLLGILSAADVSASGVVDLGGGSYLVATNGSDPAALVGKLKATAGLYDAGFVYRETPGEGGGAAPSPETTAPSENATPTPDVSPVPTSTP
jgi:hypothetical protein